MITTDDDRCLFLSGGSTAARSVSDRDISIPERLTATSSGALKFLISIAWPQIGGSQSDSTAGNYPIRRTKRLLTFMSALCTYVDLTPTDVFVSIRLPPTASTLQPAIDSFVFSVSGI